MPAKDIAQRVTATLLHGYDRLSSELARRSGITPSHPMSMIGRYVDNENPDHEYWLYINPKGRLYLQRMTEVDGLMTATGDFKRWRSRTLELEARRSDLQVTG